MTCFFRSVENLRKLKQNEEKTIRIRYIRVYVLYLNKLICSTGFSGGHQVDGLPPAPNTGAGRFPAAFQKKSKWSIAPGEVLF